MEIVHVYDIDFNWNLEDFRKFEGTNQENLIHVFGISPQDPNDPDCLYVNVEIQKVIDNDKFGRVFTATGTTTFKVRNNNQIPSVKFCFDLLDAGTFEFAKAFNAKKTGTYVFDKKIPIPTIEDFKLELENIIDNWNKIIRHTSLN